MLSNEDLLKPRYKVIADYPQNDWRVGHIIELYHQNNRVVEVQKCFYDTYPHLFKKLEWWEERKIEHMPKFVKYYWEDKLLGVEEVLAWDLARMFAYVKPNSSMPTVITMSRNVFPATEEEYNQQKK